MTEHLVLAGTPRDIGFSHGQQLAFQIASCIGIYGAAFGAPEADILVRAQVFREKINVYAPRLAEEIDGIAEGSGQDPLWIYALNARSELMSQPLPECTIAYLPEAAVVGQTWDWIDLMEGLHVVLTIEREDGHRIITMTEPGIVGKVGLNSSGIGVCLNFIEGSGRHEGVPIHIVLREMMEAQSLVHARRRLDEAGVGKSGHVLVASREGTGLSQEFASERASRRDVMAERFVHTNHCVQMETEPGLLEKNSRARIKTASQLLDAPKATPLETLKSVLSDKSLPSDNILADYRPLMGMTFGTVCTVLMDLREGEFLVRKGPDASSAFRSFRL